MTKVLFRITATWDADVAVWVAESDDVPGLSTEAPNLDLLVAKLKVMIPELLDANGASGSHDDIPFELISTLCAVAPRQAA